MTETAWAQNSEVIAQSPRDEGWILTLGLGLKNLVLFFSYATPGCAKFCRCCLHFAHRIPELLLNFHHDPKEMWEPFCLGLRGGATPTVPRASHRVPQWCRPAVQHHELLFSRRRQVEGGELSATHQLPSLALSLPSPVRTSASESEPLHCQLTAFGG